MAEPDLIRQLQGALGNVRRMQVGAGTLTGDGDDSAFVTVDHGMPVTPTAVFVTSTNADLGGSADTLTTSSFNAILTSRSGTAWSSTETFYWLAVVAG